MRRPSGRLRETGNVVVQRLVCVQSLMSSRGKSSLLIEHFSPFYQGAKVKATFLLRET
jgi:hypothetical protein